MILTALGALLCGCAAHSGGVRGVSPQTADRLDAEHSSFENTHDPPINADTRFAAGQLAEAENEPAKAVEQYKDALKLNPEHQRALFRLGSIYVELGMYPDAIDIWQRYVNATHESAAAYSNLGFCYELAHQPAKAEAAYKAGIASNPHEQPCRINYGLMLARQGRIDEAAAQLGAAVSPAEVHYNLGSVYEQQGKTADARTEYEKALLLDPNLHDAIRRLNEIK